MNRKEPQPLRKLQEGKNGSILKNGRNPPALVVKKPAPPSPPPLPPNVKSQ
jgi:hypothetical protein